MVQSVRKDIPTGSLVLLAKPNSAGESCVYLRYYLGKYVKRSTNVNVPVADWDDKHQRSREILERWKGYGRNKRFVFDMLPENYDITNQAQLHKDRNAKHRNILAAGLNAPCSGQ